VPGNPVARDAAHRVRTEIIPAEGVAARVAAALPQSATVTVTCLPRDGIRKTVDLAVELAGLGYDVMPHLAARQIGGETELRELLARLDGSGITSLFVVGGDGGTRGAGFHTGGELLQSIRDMTGQRFGLGVAGYPEGHPSMSIDAALDVLARKQALADHVVTQMCFDTAPLIDYLRLLRTAGITLPVWFGVPGPVRLRRLLEVAARIGVGPSLSFARKGHNLKLLGSGSFDSGAFRDRLDRAARVAGFPFAGFHVYSFNDFTAR